MVCGLPANVLMLSGYWPVVGSSLAIATKDGQIGLIAPEDERELAEKGWADELSTFQGGSLDEIKSAARAIRAPFSQVMKKLEAGPAIGYERGEFHEPSWYAAMHFYGDVMREILLEAAPDGRLVCADDLLKKLRSVKSPCELARMRKACRIAQIAFAHGAQNLRAGLTETEVADRFRSQLSIVGTGFDGAERADGFTFCMSGPNAARAYAAYQRSRARVLAAGDLALVHCNSYADGYWTDITRTFCLGEPDERQRRMYDAVFEARAAALDIVAPGATTASVDRAARNVIHKHGFGEKFKHPSGHGVGFSAINHNAHPRIHPASDERLETGMVFNVEPGIYLDGWGGLRHCDMVSVTATGAELMTPFQLALEELTILA